MEEPAFANDLGSAMNSFLMIFSNRKKKKTLSKGQVLARLSLLEKRKEKWLQKEK